MKTPSYILGLWLAVLLIYGCSNENDTSESTATPSQTPKEWALVMHGGAGAISKDRPQSVKDDYMAALDSALAIGEEVLSGGGRAVDAVEKVINYLEDNPKFNAGRGAVFTSDGGHELDAALMVGNSRQAGAITGVKTVKNPISLARKVMEESRHVMFSGEGAEEFAGMVGVERVNQDYFYTKDRFKAWKRAVQRESDPDGQQSLVQPDGAERDEWLKQKYGTVGCVALDREGTLVAGTSTGGMTNKQFGRVGDVPIIGAGTYASDVVAVSMTGWGERIMRAVSGHTVSDYMKFTDASLEEAGRYLLEDVLEPGDAGMIGVDKYGNMFMNMNTSGMFRGLVDSEGKREIAIWD